MTKARVHVHGQAPEVPARQITETPTETMVNSTVRAGEVTDARGRRITVRRLSALDRMRLFAAAGSELSRNEQWIGIAAIAASCAAIDGDPVPKPASRMQVEALVERLEDDGLEAIAKVYQETFGVGVEEDIAEKAEAAKN